MTMFSPENYMYSQKNTAIHHTHTITEIEAKNDI